MRESRKKIQVKELVTVEKTASIEVISTIFEDKYERRIVVEVRYEDDQGVVMGTDSFNIRNEYYDLLMSASPDFAPNKPANEYREVDIWYIIDLISS